MNFEDISSDISSSECVQEDAIFTYEKHRWLKVTFNYETKRIMDPPLDFELLKELFMHRYPVLRLLIEQPYRP